MGFIKWWWGRRDGPEKVLSLIGIDIIITLFTIPFLGVYSFIFLFSILILTVLISLLYYAVIAIMEQHEKFKKEKEKEADEIVRRLQYGNHNGPDTDGVPCAPAKLTAQQILAKLKMMAGSSP